MDTEQLDLGVKCTIIRVEELHAQMVDVLSTGQGVELDASKIEKIDTPALQLLLSFHNALKNDERQVLWKKPSEQLITTAKLLGVNTTGYQ